MSYVSISQDDGTLGDQRARLTRTTTGGPLYRTPSDASDTARLLRARAAGLRSARRNQLAPPAWGVMPYGVMLDPDAGLGFSLKPPRWMRKMQPGKILRKVALPVAAVGAALLIPGVAPMLAKTALGAGKLLIGGGKSIVGGAGRLVLGGSRAVGSAAASGFKSTILPAQAEYSAAAPAPIAQPTLVADPPIITQREMEMVDRGMSTPMIPPSPDLQKAITFAPVVLAGLAAFALFGVARGASRAARR